MKIDIALPTYNRATYLLKNIRLIQEQIKKYNLFSYYTLSVSDNYSTDETQLEVEHFIEFEKEPSFEFYYQRNSENIGLEKNTLVVMQMCNNEFIMTIGDDDFLDEGYLKYVVEKINSYPDLGCIITGVIGDFDNYKEDIRNQNFDESYEKKGFIAMYKHSHYGHFLSGLVFKRKNLIESYLSYPQYQNIYLFIYFTSYCCLNYDSIFAPKYKTLARIVAARDWSYNNTGNLNEVFKAYYPFEKEIGTKKVNELISKFVLMHSYRLRLNPIFPFYGISNFISLLQKVEPLSGLKSKLILTFIIVYIATIKQYFYKFLKIKK